MKDLIEMYDELYDEMVASNNPLRMMAFGDAEKWMFHQLAPKHPEMAEEWLRRLEASKWNNYLSEEEAEHIVYSLEEKHGDKSEQRYEWDYDTLKRAVDSSGSRMFEAPYFNCWALWATINMLYSDHHETVSAFVSPQSQFRFYYRLAMDKLKDVDRPHFVREYFHLKG